jgi:transposase-like protein
MQPPTKTFAQQAINNNNSGKLICPECKSTDIRKGGFAERYHIFCIDCGYSESFED